MTFDVGSTNGESRAVNAAPPKAAAPAAVFPDKPSIAVLPFQNMSGDPEQEYFSDGMVEEIITALSRLRWLFVIARNSSFAYKGRAVDVKQIGRELGVRYVLEGSVRKAVNRVRVTGQLVEASTGVHLWADRFEGGLEDLFDLQDPNHKLYTKKDGPVRLAIDLPFRPHAQGHPPHSKERLREIVLGAVDLQHGCGDPARATAEKGRRYLEAVSRELARVLIALAGATKGQSPYL